MKHAKKKQATKGSSKTKKQTMRQPTPLRSHVQHTIKTEQEIETTEMILGYSYAGINASTFQTLYHPPQSCIRLLYRPYPLIEEPYSDGGA
jgi:hypothetical protein